MLNLPVSNLPFLKKAYSDIIQSENDTDQTGKISSPVCQRRTFTFIDGSYLSITEFIKDGRIDRYNYDWYSAGKSLLLKFHSEKHKEKNYQTSTEPFHIHAKGLIDEKRLANPMFQDLASIMELIRLFLLAIENYEK
ncbi:toxin-antitoxin system TumE family protein [Desulfitobacterium sp. AusDCA]|uniref:toxin-antitoxin system TumE family protein n=1 Tax=Desulfitobacterium sp. AusDCA TaxID=3240383 RepID=UPI003DA769D9